MAKKIEKNEIMLSGNPAKTFRQKIQKILMDNESLLIEKMSKLPPKDFCDAYIRLLPFGFSRVPEEKTLDTDNNVKAILSEREKKITIINNNDDVYDEIEE